MQANGSVTYMQSDHGIQLNLATEIDMESEVSHHTSLLINCPVKTCFAVHLHRMMISISMVSAKQKITINCVLVQTFQIH